MNGAAIFGDKLSWRILRFGNSPDVEAMALCWCDVLAINGCWAVFESTCTAQARA